ncbi:MAG: hypothetical protein HDS04_05080 [Bacteroides sp.]|nr:hypothetical protein [Bacteroides sp.]
MNLQYYNPLSRLKLLSNCWTLSAKVKEKLEIENKASSPWRISICLDFLIGWVRHGFSMEQYLDYEIYKVKNCVRKNIVTNRRAIRLEGMYNNKQDIELLIDKSMFNERFRKFVHRKWFYMGANVPKEAFVESLSKLKEIIVKPIGGSQGKGIYKLKTKNIDLSDLYDELNGQKVLIEEVIKQHHDVAFGRKCVNTIRMYTLLDKKGQAHLIKSVLRVGAINKDVDNYHQGGSIWPLNKEEGFIESAGKTLTSNSPIYYLEPLNSFMLGYRIPNYQSAVNAVIEAAKMIPTVRYIGWDIAITDCGVEIIEANSSPDNDFHCFGCEKHYYSRLVNI